MKKDQPGLHQVTQRDAVNLLVKDVPLEIDYSKTRFVICESEYDADAFRLLDANIKIWPNRSMNLVFIGAGNIRGGVSGGKARVEGLVGQFINGSNQTVFGLIDYDNENDPSERYVVLAHKERYGIENVIFDPLLLLSLIQSSSKENLPEIGAPKYLSIEDLLDVQNTNIQNYVDKIQEIVLGDIGEAKKISVQYCSGRTLELRSEWLSKNGHELTRLIATKLIKVIKGLKTFEDASNIDNTIKALRSKILETILVNTPTLAPNAFRKALQELSQ